MRRIVNQRAKKTVKIGTWVYFLGGILAVAMFLIAGQSVSGSNHTKEDERAYYHSLEDTFREVIRTELDQDGYYNSGVTMSSVIEVNGSRSYHIVIHHERITGLTAGEKELLLSELEAIPFPEQSCPVEYEILP